MSKKIDHALLALMAVVLAILPFAASGYVIYVVNLLMVFVVLALGLHLVIGELSSVVDDSVQFYWDFVSKGTIAEGARLHFERIPAAFRCLDCQTEFGRNDRYQCPACGSGRVTISAGEEFFLRSIEVEE